MIKVKLIKPFLQVRETLNRIGVPSTKENPPRLFPSCLIVHHNDEYYISHFKELIELEGNDVIYKEDDLKRRDNIVVMLKNWGMVEPIDQVEFTDDIKVKILKASEKKDWKIIPKYRIKGKLNFDNINAKN